MVFVGLSLYGIFGFFGVVSDGIDLGFKLWIRLLGMW